LEDLGNPINGTVIWNEPLTAKKHQITMTLR